MPELSCVDARSLREAKGDPPPGEVIGRQLQLHLIARKSPDIVLAQLPTEMSEYDLPLLNLHAKHRLRQRLNNGSFDFNKVIKLN